MKGMEVGKSESCVGAGQSWGADDNLAGKKKLIARH